MINLSALSPITTAATSLSNLILATPQLNGSYQPQAKVLANGETPANPPVIVFHYEGEQTLALESDITDHYVEDNTAIQDQVALRPETFTTHGFIGELNDVVPGALKPLKQIASKLTAVVAYTPILTEAALIAYNEAFRAYQTAQAALNSARSAWSSLKTGNAGVQTKQQQMFNLFYGYWQSRTLFTVQTPWNIFNDCAIMNLRAIQDADSRVMTDFEVTFKKMRFVQVASSSKVILDGRASFQNSPLVDKGASVPSNSITVRAGLAANFPESANA